MRPILPAIAATTLMAGCSSLPRVSSTPLAPTCRTTVTESEAIRWSVRLDAAHRALADRWCAGVGPAVFRSEIDPIKPDDVMLADVAFVSWNVHVGTADIERFVADLRSGRFSNGRPVHHLVLMLQEAVRTSGVPSTLPAGARAARWIGSDHSSERNVERLADTLELSLLYVPSMRNGSLGRPDRSATDRGNAILSTLPLLGPSAIELPSERQRRVAIEARLAIGTSAGDGHLSVGTVHLDALGSARGLWFFNAVPTRVREAQTLMGSLADGPMILGADLNTWQGSAEDAVRALIRMFPSTPSPSSTFREGRSLDYLFFRLPEFWRARLTRAPERYGSDHFPLIGWVERA